MFAQINQLSSDASLPLVRTEQRGRRPPQRVLATGPIYHKLDETIRGDAFCSFLALVLVRELDRCLEWAGVQVEWPEVLRDLKALQQMELQEGHKRLWVRWQVQGCYVRVFGAVDFGLAAGAAPGRSQRPPQRPEPQFSARGKMSCQRPSCLFVTGGKSAGYKIEV